MQQGCPCSERQRLRFTVRSSLLPSSGGATTVCKASGAAGRRRLNEKRPMKERGQHDLDQMSLVCTVTHARVNSNDIEPRTGHLLQRHPRDLSKKADGKAIGKAKQDYHENRTLSRQLTERELIQFCPIDTRFSAVLLLQPLVRLPKMSITEEAAACAEWGGVLPTHKR